MVVDLDKDEVKMVNYQENIPKMPKEVCEDFKKRCHVLYNMFVCVCVCVRLCVCVCCLFIYACVHGESIVCMCVINLCHTLQLQTTEALV